MTWPSQLRWRPLPGLRCNAAPVRSMHICISSNGDTRRLDQPAAAAALAIASKLFVPSGARPAELFASLMRLTRFTGAAKTWPMVASGHYRWDRATGASGMILDPDAGRQAATVRRFERDGYAMSVDACRRSWSASVWRLRSGRGGKARRAPAHESCGCPSARASASPSSPFAKYLEPRWPWLCFLAAFAEAATIGGIADWYAVVALFRRPLGLPIPHTAIIPDNQNRIADNLGRFIEANFLAPEPVREKLQRGRFRRAGGRLAVRTRSAPPGFRASSRGWCRRRCRRSSNPGCATSSPAACTTRSRRWSSRRWRPNCSRPSPTTAAIKGCSTNSPRCSEISSPTRRRSPRCAKRSVRNCRRCSSCSAPTPIC